MRPVKNAWIVQIEITNKCNHSCSYCTRATNAFASPYYMEVERLERILNSLKGWENVVGCYGGEPTLHPDFEQICMLYRKYFPSRQCALFTSGGSQYRKQLPLIEKTFEIINVNTHSTINDHHPVLIAIDDMIEEKRYKRYLIDNCWVQHLWAPAITGRGIFFCEIAATLDMLFELNGGIPYQTNWWRNREEEFLRQREIYCGLCGMPLKIAKRKANEWPELISQSNFDRLIKIPKRFHEHFKVITKEEIHGKSVRVMGLLKYCFFPERYWMKRRERYFKASMRDHLRLAGIKVKRQIYLLFNFFRYHLGLIK